MRRVTVLACVLLPVLIWASPAVAQDKIGVPVCDEFLSKYQACVAKMPPAQQTQIKASVEQIRGGWKSMASNQQTKPSLEGMCRQMGYSIQVVTTQYNCQWN